MANDQFTIRPARAEDADAIAGFVLAMALETEDEELDAGQVQAAVRTALADPARAPYYLAVAAGPQDAAPQPIGGLMFTREWSDWNNAWYWWIQSVYVLPQWRGRGVLRALYDHLARLAREQGDVCALRLYVHESNTGAQAAYDRLGMARRPFAVYERRLDE